MIRKVTFAVMASATLVISGGMIGVSVKDKEVQEANENIEVLKDEIHDVMNELVEEVEVRTGLEKDLKKEKKKLKAEKKKVKELEAKVKSLADAKAKKEREAKKASAPSYTSTKASATSSELDLFARLVEAEARGESYKGKVAVAEVVMNRVKSKQFPNTIEGVIMQKGQYSPVSNGSINRKASQDSINAVKEAMNGTNLVGGALYFWYPEIATSRWIETREYITRIGVHEFRK